MSKTQLTTCCFYSTLCFQSGFTDGEDSIQLYYLLINTQHSADSTSLPQACCACARGGIHPSGYRSVHKLWLYEHISKPEHTCRPALDHPHTDTDSQEKTLLSEAKGQLLIFVGLSPPVVSTSILSLPVSDSLSSRLRGSEYHCLNGLNTLPGGSSFFMGSAAAREALNAAATAI